METKDMMMHNLIQMYRDYIYTGTYIDSFGKTYDDLDGILLAWEEYEKEFGDLPLITI